MRRRRFGNDGTANTVPSNADRCDTGIHSDFCDIGRINIGKRRIHVIGTRRNEIHTIYCDTQAIIGQAMNHGQAGNTPRTVEVYARHIPQQRSSIPGNGMLSRNFG